MPPVLTKQIKLGGSYETTDGTAVNRTLLSATAYRILILTHVTSCRRSDTSTNYGAVFSRTEGFMYNGTTLQKMSNPTTPITFPRGKWDTGASLSCALNASGTDIVISILGETSKHFDWSWYVFGEGILR
jgi:hypothetical protein